MTISSSDPDSRDTESSDLQVGDGRASARSHERDGGGDGAREARVAGRSGARRLALHFVLVLGGASALAGWLWGARAGLSAALGVGLAGLNLLLMQKITRAMMSGAGGSGANAAWGLALPFKLVALVGVAYALVSRGVAQPVPLAMGFALLPLTGVFLPRPTSVPGPAVPRASGLARSSRSRRDSMSRRSQPAA